MAYEMKDVKRCTRQIRTRDPMIGGPTCSPPDYQLQLPNRKKVFVIYALTLLMYTVASPDPNPRAGVNYLTLGVQLYTNECNEGETLTPNLNECNSTLTSGTSGGAAPTYTYILGEGVNYLTLRVQLYANECNEGRDSNP